MMLAYLLSQGHRIGTLINLDGFNELALPAVENIPKGLHPSYPRKWYFRTGTLYSEESLRDIGMLTWLGNLRNAFARIASSTWPRHSVTLSVLWDRLDRGLAKNQYLVYARFYARPSQAQTYEQTGSAYHADSEGQLYTDLARIWADSSLQMQRLCVANGIRYFHFLQPNQYVPGSKILSDEEKRNFVASDSAYRVPVEKGYPYLLKEAERLRTEGVHFTELSGLFKDETQTVYKDSCCHFNEYGYKRLGEAVEKVIESASTA